MNKLLTWHQLAFICMITSLYAPSQAQKLVSTQGDFYSTDTGSVSFSIGEIATASFTSAEGSLEQGFQQVHLPDESIALRVNGFDSNIEIYPNPFSSDIHLKVTNIDPESIRYTIHHISGQEMASGLIGARGFSVKTIDFQPGSYLLTLIHNQTHQSESHLIIKK